MKAGDRNTSYFQNFVKVRRQMNSWSKLMIADELIDNQGLIDDHIINHFSNLYADPVKNRPTLEGLSFARVSESQNASLIRPFEEEEVLAALNALPNAKTPGVDGFPIGLLKKSWFMKDDVLCFLQDFHSTGRMDWRLNTTLLTLIPTKRDASWINDFRPISLVSAVYKILAKLLANRLKDCLPLLISHNQSAVISERQILDGVLVAKTRFGI